MKCNKQRRKTAFLLSIPALVGAQAAWAATDTWNGSTNNNWATGANWTATSPPPTSADNAVFSASSTNSAITLGGTTQNLNSLIFSSAPVGYNIGITAGDTLNFTSGGVIAVTNGVSQTISANIVLNGNMTITNQITSGDVMDFAGNISGAFFINTVGSSSKGNYEFDGANTFSGGMNIANGPIYAFGSSSVYSGASITSGPMGSGTVSITNSPVFEAVGAARVVANPLILVGGNGFKVTNAATAEGLTFAGAISYASGTQSLEIDTPGQTFYFGTSGTPATLTLPSAASSNLTIQGTAGTTIVINDVIQDANLASPSVEVFYNNWRNGGAGTVNPGYTVLLNSASTYGGGTGLNGSNGIYQLNLSTVSSGTTVVSGPFGTGKILPAQATSELVPYGADRTLANAIQMNTGFMVASDPTGAHNLTLSGPISETTSSRFITNNINSGVALYLGLAGTNASTITLGSTSGQTLETQSQNGTNGGGVTIVNDVIQDASGGGSGSLLAQLGGTLYLNAVNTFSGGITIGYPSATSVASATPTVVVSSDANLGSSTGAINFAGNSSSVVSTLLSTGTFTSARTINLNAYTPTNAVFSNIIDTIDATGTNVLTLTGPIISGTNGTGDLTKGTNSGTLQLAQSGGLSISGNVNANGGTLLVGPTGGETGPLSVGGTLTVNSGALAAIAPGLPSNSVTNSVSTLTLNGSGQFDLANSNLITSTPSNTIRQYLINGFNGGAWNGTGGISSVNANASYNIPASNGGHFTALGYSSGTTIAALGLTAGQTLVKYTIYGDANLDGIVDINDLNIVLSNFLSGNPATWDTGDFYYAGETDISDLNAVLSNFFDTAPTTVRAAKAAARASASTASTAKTLTGTVSPADTVSPPPANGVLELVVNTTSGDVELEGNNADIASLQITSASSGIITANWTDLHANGYTNWSDTAKKKTGIGEYDNQFTATGDYAVLGVVDYGDIYNTSVNAEDYVFKYGSVESNDTTVDTDTGSVIYVSGVPEPTTLSLMGLAVAGLKGRRRKIARS